VNSYYTKRFAGYSIPEQMRDVFPYLVSSATMGIVVALVNVPLPTAHPLQLVLKIAVGAACYLAICRGLRLTALDEFISLVSRRRAISA
jgi:hypothetical protein